MQIADQVIEFIFYFKNLIRQDGVVIMLVSVRTDT